MAKLTMRPIAHRGDSQKYEGPPSLYKVLGLPEGYEAEIDRDAPNCWIVHLKKNSIDQNFKGTFLDEHLALAALQLENDRILRNQ